MSSVSSIGNAAATVQLLTGQTQSSRPSDGDTAAQEAAESPATKVAEKSNNGRAPNSAGLVNKTA